MVLMVVLIGLEALAVLQAPRVLYWALGVSDRQRRAHRRNPRALNRFLVGLATVVVVTLPACANHRGNPNWDQKKIARENKKILDDAQRRFDKSRKEFDKELRKKEHAAASDAAGPGPAKP